MNRSKLITIVVLATVAVAVAFGAVAYRSASAQADVTTTPEATTPTNPGNSTGRLGDRLPSGSSSSEELAAALGITTDELNTAYQAAYEKALAQAVEQGLITQTQADDLKAKGSTFHLGGRGNRWLSGGDIDFDALLAEALGISVDELQAAYSQAYIARIDQAVTDGTMTAEQADLMKGQYLLRNNTAFQDAMQTAYQAAVQQAVSDGVITQAQADLILANSADHFDGGMGLPGLGGMGGGHGHHGGRGEAPATP